MPATSVNLEKRISVLASILTEHAEQHAVERENSKPPMVLGWSRSVG